LLTRMTGISLHMQCVMASDFSVAWQCLSKRTIVFFVTDQTPRPYPTRSLPAKFWHRCIEWSTVWVSSKPLITEENWPGQGLNPGLPNDTPVLYPLLHELMLETLFNLFLIINTVSLHTYIYPTTHSSNLRLWRRSACLINCFIIRQYIWPCR
jgi:hypothetical protein